MTLDRLYNLFFILFFFLFYLSIPFWIPAAIGLYLLTSRRNRLSYMAGFLTLKPIITTPIWAVIINLLHDPPVDAQLIAVWSILLGAGLTVLALVIFWRLFFGSRAILAMLLIVLDCMCWINSSLLTVTITLPYNPATGTRTGIFVLIGLIVPTVYSVIALATTLATNEVQTAAQMQSEQNVSLPTTGPTCRPCSLTLTPSLRVIEIQRRRIASMTILSQLQPLVTARVTSTVSPIN